MPHPDVRHPDVRHPDVPRSDVNAVPEPAGAPEPPDLVVRLPEQPAALRADLAAGLAPTLARVVTGARRRALRDGDRQIDTAHLLHALLESDPEVGAVFDGGRQAARVLGYLVQRSIGYGLRWQRAGEETAGGGLLPAVRGAHGRGPRASAWSPAAAAALEESFRRAAARGEEHARGLDLLAVVAAETGSRAAEVLRRAGVDPAELAGRAEGRLEAGGRRVLAARDDTSCAGSGGVASVEPSQQV